QSGVSLYRVNFDEFEGTSKIRHYAGLWLGTDLGAPLRADTNTKTTWNAYATLYLGNRIQGDNQDFTLEVDFTNKTIKSIDKTTSQNPISIIHGVADRGHLTIDGKFTELGVIYGSTEFAWATEEGNADLNGGVSTGSLTGLVGEYGVVGAFISDGDATAGTYVGGFVALNPNACDVTPFSAFCESTTFYDTVRLQACIDDGTDAGVYAGCPDLRNRLCPNSGTRHELCPELAVTAGKVDFVRWVKTAKDAPNTNPLTVLPAITGSGDPDFNYVEGRVNELEVGDVRTAEEKQNGWRISTSFGENIGGTLKLSELAGGADDTGSGVALRLFRIRNGGNNIVDGIIGNIKYHTGILSNTDLGAPISAAGPITTALWDAKIQIVTTDSGVSRIRTDDFTMVVNFNPNTIRTRETADSHGPADPISFGLLTSLRIYGSFTADGVIYGTTTLRIGAESTGSLTGLIGERGAVGVFLSDTDTTAGFYAGGFVAVPMLCEFYPFGSSCNTDENIMAKQAKCHENPLVNGVDGCDATFDIICRDGSAGAIVGNPFDAFCLGNATYDNARVKACVSGEG
ncbi:MAG: hypothetical protein K8953_06080, partial [Proteobacteria bacterium]|nr:hypothetical protein [Pseudomonadota bacterium]